MSLGLWAVPATVEPSPSPSPSPSSTSEPSPTSAPVEFTGATSEQLDQLLALVQALGFVFAVGLGLVLLLLAYRVLAAEQ